MRGIMSQWCAEEKEKEKERGFSVSFLSRVDVQTGSQLSSSKSQRLQLIFTLDTMWKCSYETSEIAEI